jgi:paired amphipathic helix protein Sin3a
MNGTTLRYFYAGMFTVVELPDVCLITETGYKYRSMTADELPLCVTQNNIGIQISLGTYKLFYEAGTEDVLWRPRSDGEQSSLDERAKTRHEERRSCALL